MDQPEQDILIEKFIAGTLTPAEQAIFDAKYQDDDFVREVQFQQDLQVAAISNSRDELRAIMVSESPARTAAVGHPVRRNLYRWAAVAAILIIGLAIYFMPKSLSSTEQIYAHYYEPFPNTLTPITKGEATEMDAYQMYEAGQYDDAIATLDAIENPIPGDQFYLASAYLARGDLADAARSFRPLELGSSNFQVPAKWYQALILIRQEKINDALQRLQEIAQENHPLATRAENLIRDLEK